MKLLEFESLDSTNQEIKRIWPRLGGTQPVAVRALRQTAGRGRGNRTWLSPVGGLWFSLGRPLQPGTAPPAGLSLVAGLALVEAIDSCCGLECSIKWPNDLIVNDKKLAGILCASFPGEKPPLVIIGTGINGNYAATELGNDLLFPPTTLQDELAREINLGELFQASLKSLNERLAQLEQGGFTLFRETITEHLLWRGKTVAIHLPDGNTWQGELTGIDETGALLLTSNGQKKKIVAGDLTQLRPERGGDTEPGSKSPPW